MSDQITWAEYLTRGIKKIYHMCDKEAFINSTKDGGMYYPPTYQQDGFIHATAEPKVVIIIIIIIIIITTTTTSYFLMLVHIYHYY